MIKCLKELTAVSEAKTSRVLRRLIEILHDSGSGGGGECGCEPFMITGAHDAEAQTITLNKTWTEIYEAFMAGKQCIITADMLLDQTINISVTEVSRLYIYEVTGTTYYNGWLLAEFSCLTATDHPVLTYGGSN